MFGGAWDSGIYGSLDVGGMEIGAKVVGQFSYLGGSVSNLAGMFPSEHIVVFDSERRQTKFVDYCETCGQYAQVAGATPAFLKTVSEPINDGIFRTDVVFGSYRRKHPLVIIGLETKKLIQKARFSGRSFRPVYGAGEKVTLPSGLVI